VEETEKLITRYFYVVYKVADEEFGVAVSLTIPKNIRVPLIHVLTELAKHHRKQVILKVIEEIDKSEYLGFSRYRGLLETFDTY
jgi:hypothetical protein